MCIRDRPTVAKVESVLMLVPDRQPEKVKLIRQFAPLLAPVQVGTATSLDPAALRAPLEQLQQQIARDFADKLTSFQKSVTPRLIEPGDAPPEIRNRYVGKSGRYL